MSRRIEDYALIGDCESAALVACDGSIDWLCWPHFDSGACFAALLGTPENGRWRIAPQDETARVSRRYRDDTLVLETVFETADGTVALIDFMPPRGKASDLVRIVEGRRGTVAMCCELVWRFDYGSIVPWVTRLDDQTLSAIAGPDRAVLRTPITLRGEDMKTVGSFDIAAGERIPFVMSYGVSHLPPPEPIDPLAALAETEESWRRWASRCSDAGRWTPLVRRSLITLKALTYRPTGAIVAAPTTSLPEVIGGERNWDYRFTWLRDAAFTLYAFFQLGLTAEATAYFDWLTHRHLADRKSTDIPNLFDLSGHAHATEHVLDHLEGYRGSKPVRVGNAAVNQLQLDVYGEVLDSAYVYARFGGGVSQTLWEELSNIVEIAIARWEEPDSSIWEVRSERRQYVYSKLMCWVAVDRGIRIGERYNLPYDKLAWRRARTRIHRAITARGFSEHRHSFTQEFDNDALDAAILRISQVRFLPDKDPRIRSTVHAIAQHLGEGVLVKRYLLDESEDGLRGDEGAFFMTSFWLVDALAHTGDLERAERRFERLLHFSSPLQLFSEEVDVRTGELLGNFPQAFTHLALVGAAVNMERARRRELGVKGLRKR
jgi:GH15 family glucan-1,4-alpha-glucosidase